MCRTARARGLAPEFGGNWLDFRRFEEHNAVDRERFPSFTNELRKAMFEEPIRFSDTVQRRPLRPRFPLGATRSSTRLWPGTTGCRTRRRGEIGHSGRCARSTAAAGCCRCRSSSPKRAGLRTSPVKRGYWVVRRLLGEHIPPPPPNVPVLPTDETKLGD